LRGRRRKGSKDILKHRCAKRIESLGRSFSSVCCLIARRTKRKIGRSGGIKENYGVSDVKIRGPVKSRRFIKTGRGFIAHFVKNRLRRRNQPSWRVKGSSRLGIHCEKGNG
jgi:hypothetical protein